MATDSLFALRKMTSCRQDSAWAKKYRLRRLMWGRPLAFRRLMRRISFILVVVLFNLTGHIAQAQDQSCETCKTTVQVDMQASVCAAENVPIDLAGTTATAAGVCTLDQW